MRVGQKIIFLASAVILVSCGGGGGSGGGGMPMDVGGSAANAAILADAGSSASLAAPGSALAADISDATHKVDPTAYRAMAAQLSQDAGIAYRYGPDASAYGMTGNNGVPTWYRRPDNSTTSASSPCQTMPGRIWQGGGARTNDAGNFSSNQGNVAFVANTASSTGVADIAISGVECNTFSQAPGVSWTRWDRGLEDDSAVSYKKAGQSASAPVAIGRCAGHPGFCSTGIAVFQSGLIGVYAGSNTATNKATVQLDAGLVPTSVAVSNDGEFALVPVWDTINLRGRVAVIALAGLCDGCNPYNSASPKAWYEWWGEWMGVYPGLANRGNIAFMKILGYVDLPDMTAPTEIAVTTGMDQYDTMLTPPSGTPIVGGYGTPLTDESNRQSFNPGGRNATKYAKAGVAVVISKSEQKAIFIDLKPLFTYVNSVYFGGTQSDFAKTVNNLGQAATQWPHAFSFKPQQMPTLIKTVSLASKPTAVKTTIWGSAHRAWLATQDGQLHIYSLGKYPVGQGTAADIQEKSSVVVGRNPTGLAHAKLDPANPDAEVTNSQLIVVSRGDRKIDWVKFSSDSNSGSVVRTLRDTRMVDPIAADDGDNFYNQLAVLTVADYGSKSISNYRYGPVVFGQSGNSGDGVPWACQKPGCGMGQSGTDPFEFGGSLALPGKPFQVISANTP